MFSHILCNEYSSYILSIYNGIMIINSLVSDGRRIIATDELLLRWELGITTIGTCISLKVPRIGPLV